MKALNLIAMRLLLWALGFRATQRSRPEAWRRKAHRTRVSVAVRPHARLVIVPARMNVLERP